jgi:hypothetical protein
VFLSGTYFAHFGSSKKALAKQSEEIQKVALRFPIKLAFLNRARL